MSLNTSSNRANPFRLHAVEVVGVIGYVVLGVVLERTLGIRDMMGQLGYVRTYLLYWGLLLYSGVVVLVWTRWRLRDATGRRPAGSAAWAEAWARFRARLADPAQGGSVLLLALLIPTFMNAFGSWKAAIPRLHPFTWDQAFMELDRLVHFGRHPWEWLQPVIGHPAITAAWDYGYSLFIPIQVGVVLWMTWATHAGPRRRFFIAYVLAWTLLGTVAAMLLASGGPCFYAAITDLPDPYAPLLEYLRSVDRQYDLGALEAQAVLWANHTSQVSAPFAGISAMPSMHVALPTLFVLVAAKVSRGLTALAVGYLVFNLVGAVHLGWHYAIDGYAAIAGMVVVWAIAGRLARVGQEPETDRHRARTTTLEPSLPATEPPVA